MTNVKKGGCQCGQIRFEVHGEPVKVYACHCTICQKQSGSAFGMAAVYGQQFFKVTEGKPSNFIREGTEKNVKNYFCSNCGARIYHQWFTSDGVSPVVNIKPGTLDDTSWLNPGCHVWTQHAQSWVRFADDDVLFEEQPADLSEMPGYTTLQPGNVQNHT